MAKIVQCGKDECVRLVVEGRYCSRHAGRPAWLADQRAVVEEERKKRRAVVEEDDKEFMREQRRRAHVRGRWGLGQGGGGKTARKEENRRLAAIAAAEAADRSARANWVRQALDAWRTERTTELAAEFRVDMTSARDKGREKVLAAVKAEEPAKRAELEVNVAAMDRLPTSAKPAVANKPKKGKKGGKGDKDGGDGKGKNGGNKKKGGGKGK